MDAEYQQAREQLEEILNRKEYTGGDWLERGIRFIDEFLEGLDWLPSLSFPGWEIPPWLLPAVLFLFFVFSLVWVRGHLTLNRRLKGNGKESAPGKPASGEKLQELGEEAARRGDFRLAIRYLFQSVLTALRDQGMLSEVSRRTHREQIAEIRSRMPERCSLFESLVFRFEEAWYGQVPVGPGDYHRFREEADMLLKGDPAHAAEG
ncbi:uncharacterized protein DUF4129 [Planifilum fimeticola]|uniref:Uncharacterized protein DUF4129 n=1 Tax=Planifilum fimeticola TaxID=201975 RepID=A0A2T0LHR8_9BACL|nr:DUF4129 domain-containing protein [Planifilum fimeticola]PRX41788.1 uncharacterized protein DUF4129 [Planifilum fimeticola]